MSHFHTSHKTIQPSSEVKRCGNGNRKQETVLLSPFSATLNLVNARYTTSTACVVQPCRCNVLQGPDSGVHRHGNGTANLICWVQPTPMSRNTTTMPGDTARTPSLKDTHAPNDLGDMTCGSEIENPRQSKHRTSLDHPSQGLFRPVPFPFFLFQW